MSSQSPPSSHYHDASEDHRRLPVKADDDKVCSPLASHIIKARPDPPQTYNPFRNRLPTSASAVSFVSQETHSSGPGRQKPVRTVFDDLSTAHSSITSRTTRNKQHATSNPASEAWEEENSIPLQDLDPPTRRTYPAPLLLDNLPLPPLPAATVQHRLHKHSNESDLCLVAEDDKYFSEKQAKQNATKRKQPQNPMKGSSVYHTSLGAPPSSLPRNKVSLNNGSRSQRHKYESYAASLPFPDLGRTPARPEQSHGKAGQSSKINTAASNAASSLPEGSTVGNIYNHYIDDDSEDWDDVQSEHDLGDGYPTQRFGSGGNGFSSSSTSKGQQSALEHRKQRRAERMKSGGQPPIAALPSLPDPSSRLLPSSSRGLGPSSSYEDTLDLLHLAEQSPLTLNQPVRANERNDMRVNQNLCGLEDSLQETLPHGITSNPFRHHKGPQIHISPAVEENDDTNEERVPLDREISNALRRASNFSAYSDGSIATSIAENYRRFQSEQSTSNGLGMLHRQLENSPTVEIDNEERTQAAAARAFYAQEAIPPKWIADRQHNMVRVPIQPQNNFYPVSPKVEEDEEEAGDANDWETVGESGFDPEYKSSTPAMFRQTGSSIADTSDAGTASTHIPEITEYGSTERITQHPGHIEYHGDYRQRDLKRTNIPVMFPVYGGHKINGYPQDSYRLRSPRNDYYHTPEPIRQPHANPFKSPPPPIDQKPSANRPYSSLKNRRQRPSKPNHFPSPVSIKTNSSSDETETEQRRAPSGRPARSGAVQNFSRPSNWMDNYTESPEAKRNGAFLEEIPHVAGSPNRPSSWHLATAFANGETVSGYTLNGVRIVPDAEQGRVGTDGFVEQKTYGGRHGPTGTREQNTLIKGPPGAFYRSLSRTQEERAPSQKTEGTRKLTNTYRQSSANGPTNSLRPLALAGRQDRPRTPLDNIDVDMDMYPNPSLSREPNDFIFESPRGAPKRKTWQDLYTDEQMAEFRATTGDGAGESRTSGLRTGLLGGSDAPTRQRDRSVHLYEEPRLWKGQQRRGFWSYEQPRERDRFDPERKIKKWSMVALVLCNFCPPLLLPFSMGMLDWVVTWFSTGQQNAFGRDEKHTAKLCMGVWTLLFAVAVTVVLVWYFAIHGVRK
jgi:hypothetical protein